MNLGDRLKELRKKRKYSQEDLAKIIGINRGTYGQYEIGRRNPDYETLKKLAEFYGVTTDYLLGLEKKEKEDSIDIKEALKNKRATWGGQELTPEQREILTEFFAIIRDRVKEGRKVSEEKKDDETKSAEEKKLIKSIKLLAWMHTLYHLCILFYLTN